MFDGAGPNVRFWRKAGIGKLVIASGDRREGILMLIVAGATIAAGVLGSLTDWLFMGVLFHGAYNRYPEVWRPDIAAGQERNAILLSAVIGFVMSAAIVALCGYAHVGSAGGGLLVAVLAWIAGPLALMTINGLFIKLDVRVIVAHSFGYLARFALAGIAAGLTLPLRH